VRAPGRPSPFPLHVRRAARAARFVSCLRPHLAKKRSRIVGAASVVCRFVSVAQSSDCGQTLGVNEVERRCVMAEGPDAPDFKVSEHPSNDCPTEEVSNVT